MIVDMVSDLHGHYPQLAGGDLLIVAGDLTARDTVEDWCKYFAWLEKCHEKYKMCIIIAGNHDNKIQEGKICPASCFNEKSIYLCDSSTEFEGLKIYGSPWIKTFPGMNPHCKAFTVETEEELAAKWALIPGDVDILITHSPPQGIMDEVENISMHGHRYEHCGSESLLMQATKLSRLKLFVFGHIHEGYGIIKPEEIRCFVNIQLPFLGPAQCKSMPYLVNASHVNERYEPVNKPIRVEL